MRYVLVCSLAFAGSLAIAADGDLDPSFGSGGKVRIPYTDVQAADIGEQSDGTLLLVGWRTDVNNAVIVPFTAGGSATGYVAIGCAGTCQLVSVAVLPDNRFVVAGTNGSSGMVRRETANYPFNPDTSFHGSGVLTLDPETSGDAIEIKRMVLDAQGNIVIAGIYHHATSGDNDFYAARISADGNSVASAKYSFQTASSNSDIAYDLAIATDGTYYLAGTATSAAGDLDCAVAHFHYSGGMLQTDATFSGSPGLTIGLNYGSDNNDNCLALALQPPSGNLILGGQATAVLGIVWNAAVVITQPADGSSNQRVAHVFWYDQSTSPQAGQTDSVKRVLIEPYDKRVLLVGEGPNHAGATSQDLAVQRLSGPSTPDTSFGNNGFALYDVGSGVNANTNHTASAALTRRGLVIVGSAEDDSAGIDVAMVRLAPFDGIFKDGFEG